MKGLTLCLEALKLLRPRLVPRIRAGVLLSENQRRAQFVLEVLALSHLSLELRDSPLNLGGALLRKGLPLCLLPLVLLAWRASPKNPRRISRALVAADDVIEFLLILNLFARRQKVVSLNLDAPEVRAS